MVVTIVILSQNFSYFLSFLTDTVFPFRHKMYSMTLVLDFGQNYLKLSYKLYLITADNRQTILWKVSKVDSGNQRVKGTTIRQCVHYRSNRTVFELSTHNLN